MIETAFLVLIYRSGKSEIIGTKIVMRRGTYPKSLELRDVDWALRIKKLIGKLTILFLGPQYDFNLSYVDYMLKLQKLNEKQFSKS